MTAQLLREILDSVRDDIETLGMDEAMTEGEDAPNAEECAAIERVEGMLQSCADELLRSASFGTAATPPANRHGREVRGQRSLRERTYRRRDCTA